MGPCPGVRKAVAIYIQVFDSQRQRDLCDRVGRIYACVDAHESLNRETSVKVKAAPATRVASSTRNIDIDRLPRIGSHRAGAGGRGDHEKNLVRRQDGRG